MANNLGGRGSIDTAYLTRMPGGRTPGNRAAFGGFGQPSGASRGARPSTTSHIPTDNQMTPGRPILATQPGAGGRLTSVPRTTGGR